MKQILNPRTIFFEKWREYSLEGEVSIIMLKALTTLCCKGERATMQNNTHAKPNMTELGLWFGFG